MLKCLKSTNLNIKLLLHVLCILHFQKRVPHRYNRSVVENEIYTQIPILLFLYGYTKRIFD